MNLYGVPSHEVDDVWPKVAPFIEEAVKYCDGKWTALDVLEAIQKQEAQLFLVVDQSIHAAVVTQIQKYPSKKVLTILFLGGRGMPEWVHLVSEIERWAKELECDSLEVWGRYGWGKILGWKKTSTVISKNIAR